MTKRPISGYFAVRAFSLLTAFATLLFVTPPAWAQKVLLTVKHQNQAIDMTLADLKALPATIVTTETIWTDQEHTYTSILFADLIKTLNIDTKGKSATMTALNDYAIKVNVETLIQHNAFIAYAQDGEPMRIRDKGPLWVLYPFSDQPEINIPPFQAHAIWQLKTLEFH